MNEEKNEATVHADMAETKAACEACCTLPETCYCQEHAPLAQLLMECVFGD